MKFREKAQAMYDEMTPMRQKWEMLGTMPTKIMGASVDEIESHLRTVAEVAEEYDVNLDAAKVEFGAPRDDVAAKAQAKINRRKRSAGARALSRKYGKTTAEQIIARKTGRHVTLQQ